MRSMRLVHDMAALCVGFTQVLQGLRSCSTIASKGSCHCGLLISGRLHTLGCYFQQSSGLLHISTQSRLVVA